MEGDVQDFWASGFVAATCTQVTSRKRLVGPCNIISDGRGAQQDGLHRAYVTVSNRVLLCQCHRRCGLHTSCVPRGARLLLKDRIQLRGGITFSGRLSVQGLVELQEACIYAFGDLTVASGAVLHVENCTNRWGEGGALKARDSLRVDGHLEVLNSHAEFGGGVYTAYGASPELPAPPPR